MAQMGRRETEESARSQPRAVAQAGATSPFPRFRGAKFTTENRKVAWRTQRHHGSRIMPNSQCFVFFFMSFYVQLANPKMLTYSFKSMNIKYYFHLPQLLKMFISGGC